MNFLFSTVGCNIAANLLILLTKFLLSNMIWLDCRSLYEVLYFNFMPQRYTFFINHQKDFLFFVNFVYLRECIFL